MMTNTRTTRIVRLSSPIATPKPRTFPVYAGRQILNTRAGDVDSSQLADGLNEIQAIVGVKIGHDGRSLTLDLLIKHIDTPSRMGAFIAATGALLRRCADNADSPLFPELTPDENLTISFDRQ